MIRKQEITTFEFPEGAVIWDVREEKSYKEGHVQGAVNHPLATLDASVLEQVPNGQFIFYVAVEAKRHAQQNNSKHGMQNANT